MKPEWDLTITISNPVFRVIRWVRTHLLVHRWNRDAKTWMRELVDSSPDPERAFFYWSQLVWQELWSCVHHGIKMGPEEFEWLCKRRGFDERQTAYLRERLQGLSLWDDKPLGAPK